MQYETFLETVKQSLAQRLGSDYTLDIRPIKKNNGLALHGLCISQPEELAAPAIHLTPFYESFQKGRPFSDILNEITDLYEEAHLPAPLCLDEFLCPDDVGNKIVFRLINRSANQELLNEVPHISYKTLDLTLIFYLSLQKNPDSVLSALIYNRHLKSWGLTCANLYRAAKHNTPRLLPPRLQPLVQMVKDIAAKSASELDTEGFNEFLDTMPQPNPMYVLSNTAGINGAGTLFYKDTLKDFAACCQRDLVILPSSIHEVLILPYHKGLSFQELAAMVVSINRDEVPAEDRLSNNIYYYSKSRNLLTMALSSPVPLGF